MEWRERIAGDPKVLMGKPVIKKTNFRRAHHRPPSERLVTWENNSELPSRFR